LRSAAWNFNLFFAARTIHDHSRSSFLNGKMLTTARATKTDIHARIAGFSGANSSSWPPHLPSGNQKRF
jgi:hypothetical protein